MKKILLFLLIFAPFPSLYADDCEIELHTGSVQRTGSFVFPKGVKIQEFEVDTRKYWRNGMGMNDTYLSIIEQKYGGRWTRAVGSGLVDIIGNYPQYEQDDYFLETWMQFALSMPTTQKERKGEYYPIDFEHMSWYSDSQYRDAFLLTHSMPKVFVFSPRYVPRKTTNLEEIRFKICTVDQDKIAELWGFATNIQQKSLVLVPYYTFSIPKENPIEYMTFYTIKNDDFDDYSQTYIQDGKPYLPIEYK